MIRQQFKHVDYTRLAGKLNCEWLSAELETETETRRCYSSGYRAEAGERNRIKCAPWFRGALPSSLPKDVVHGVLWRFVALHDRDAVCCQAL